MGWLPGGTWPLAIQLRLEPAAYLKQRPLPRAIVGLGTMMGRFFLEADLVCV